MYLYICYFGLIHINKYNDNTTAHYNLEAFIESLQKSIVLLIPCFNILQGTGKTYTGTKLVYLFDKINSRMQEEGHAKMQLVFCGPNNKSVDLVASKFRFE